MIPEMRILRVTSIGETEKENAQVTLSAMNIKMTLAVDGEMQGRPVKMTTILFLDGDAVEIAVSEFDLLQIENCVGAYGFYQE
jgi:hypothetical protein